MPLMAWALAPNFWHPRKFQELQAVPRAVHIIHTDSLICSVNSRLMRSGTYNHVSYPSWGTEIGYAGNIQSLCFAHNNGRVKNDAKTLFGANVFEQTVEIGEYLSSTKQQGYWPIIDYEESLVAGENHTKESREVPRWSLALFLAGS